ncbi:MAG: oxygen-independent coproporphyrinogen III oxidase [Pseudomonadota bacterium]
MSTFPPLSPELVARLDMPGPRYTSYPTVPAWSASFGSDDYVRALAVASASARATEPLSLYVHIPFCREMCSYCGCNVIVAKDPGKADRYLSFLARESARIGAVLGTGRSLARLHLGGGTPTFLSEKQLESLWRTVTSAFAIGDHAEVAVEIDPCVTSRGQLSLLRGLGFNRLSMGVQDLDPRVQALSGRIQSLETTRSVFSACRELGYSSINMDLIYGLPGQQPDSWRKTIEQVIAMRPDRIAAFSFAYLPEAKPHQRRLPAGEIPRGLAKLELLRLAHDGLVEAGYRAIGMDHFALPGDELAQAQEQRTLWRDFQGYTTLRATDTLALGITGIGSVGGAFVQTTKSLVRYQTDLEAAHLPIERGHWLSPDDRRRREAITQLMCNCWVDLGEDGQDYFADELRALAKLEEDGLVVRDGAQLSVTALGRVFIRNVAMVFDAYLAKQRDDNRRFSRTV